MKIIALVGTDDRIIVVYNDDVIPQRGDSIAVGEALYQVIGVVYFIRTDEEVQEDEVKLDVQINVVPIDTSKPQ